MCCVYHIVSFMCFVNGFLFICSFLIKIYQLDILGIVGIVENIDGEPMTESTVRIQGIEKSYAVSKRSGHFKIIVSPGEYVIQISCHQYLDQDLTVTVVEGKLTNLTIHLTKDDRQVPEVYQGTIVLSSAEQHYVTDNSINKPFIGNIKTGIKGKLLMF